MINEETINNAMKMGPMAIGLSLCFLRKKKAKIAVVTVRSILIAEAIRLLLLKLVNNIRQTEVPKVANANKRKTSAD